MLPPTPAFPAIHALLLMVLLSLPRVAYRLMQENPERPREPAQTVLLVGAGEGADLFIRALAGDRRRAVPRSAACCRSATRRPGGASTATRSWARSTTPPPCWPRLRAEDRLPSVLVVTDADLPASALARLMEAADREGLRVRRAPRPTALDPAQAAAAAAVELKPVAIEDLLNRPQVPLDRDGMARLIQGRRVLVDRRRRHDRQRTGAPGRGPRARAR